VIAYGLFIFSSKVTNIIANSDLPVGYTVSNWQLLLVIER
jgi:hypothetical protein